MDETSLSMQETFVEDQVRRLKVHPANRHWMDKSKIGFNCKNSIIAKNSDGDIHVFQRGDHEEACKSINIRITLAPEVQTWIKQLLQTGVSGIRLFDWVHITPPEGNLKCLYALKTHSLFEISLLKLNKQEILMICRYKPYTTAQ